MRSLPLLLLLLLFFGPIGLNQAFAAYPSNDDRYLRVRLEAQLPLRMNNSIQHQFHLCHAEQCLPIFAIRSDLSQRERPNNRFRQVEYFSFSKVRQVAIELGADPNKQFPEVLADFSVQIDSTLQGLKKFQASGSIPALYLAGTSLALRQQNSSVSGDWKIPVHYGIAREISLHAEISILQVVGNDITESFESMSADASTLTRLRSYQVVFVTGADGFKSKYFGKEYFNLAQAWLTRNGIENTRVVPPQNKPTAEQALYFRKYFQSLRNPKPIILVAYSIANTNFMEFLLRYGKEVTEHKRIAGWIVGNASFLGNPTMEDYYNDPDQRFVVQMLSNNQGLEDIRYLHRDAYLDENFWKIQDAVKSLPKVIAISSRINAADFPSDRQKRHLELYARGLENDGSTGTFSHIIPGVDYIRFDGTDHELLSQGTNHYGANPFAIYLKIFQRILDSQN